MRVAPLNRYIVLKDYTPKEENPHASAAVESTFYMPKEFFQERAENMDKYELRVVDAVSEHCHNLDQLSIGDVIVVETSMIEALPDPDGNMVQVITENYILVKYSDL
jgi:hypothetical protein